MKIEESITFDVLRSVGKLIAVSVPTKQAITAKKTASGTFNTIANKQRLVGMKVVYTKGDMLAGMTVFCREAEVDTAPEFRQMYKLPKLDGKGNPVDDEKNDNPEFVLISEDRIVVVDLTVPNSAVPSGATPSGPATIPLPTHLRFVYPEPPNFLAPAPFPWPLPATTPRWPDHLQPDIGDGPLPEVIWKTEPSGG